MGRDAIVGGVLSIAKLTPGQESYYERSVADEIDDYYTGRGESPGVWVGRGAAELEAGAVKGGSSGIPGDARSLIGGALPTRRSCSSASRRSGRRGGIPRAEVSPPGRFPAAPSRRAR